jgi:hypothetical protein
LGFSGCAPKETVVVKTEYIKQNIPKPIKKPLGAQYQVKEIDFNGVSFYCLDSQNAKILAVNWLLYKEWAENNELILNKLYEGSLDANKSK